MKYILKLSGARTSNRGYLILEWALNTFWSKIRPPFAQGTFALSKDHVFLSEYEENRDLTEEECEILNFVIDPGEEIAGRLAILLALLGSVTISPTPDPHWEPEVILSRRDFSKMRRELNKSK